MRQSSFLLLLGVLGLGIGAAAAADWPQWRGVDREGITREKGLLQEWPKDGPKLLWKASEIGNGYSTPSVVGGKLYVISNRDQDEFLLCLDTKDGKKLWSTKIGKVGQNMGPQYPGSRSTPTADGELVYGLASGGNLVCLDAAKGQVQWQKNLRTDFGGDMGMWAYAESPLIDGEALICSPGGKTATMLALDKKTGEVIWKSAIPGGEQAAYSSPVIVEAGKVKQYVTFLGKGLVGVDAKTGKFLWRNDKTADQAANIPTPVVRGDLVFTSTSRNSTALIKLEAAGDGVKVNEVFTNKEKLNSIGGEVLVGDFIYGTNQTELMCMEFKTGQVKWRNDCVGGASLCFGDGCLYVRGHKSGTVALVAATPEGYRERGRLEQPDRSDKDAWPHPIIANGCLYLRDQGTLLCYDIKA